MEKVIVDEGERLKTVVKAIETGNKGKLKEKWHPVTLNFYERMKAKVIQYGIDHPQTPE